jgi:hypothetical protein
LTPREADECTVDELEEWAAASKLLRAEAALRLTQGVFAGSAPCAAKEGAAVFEKHQRRLLDEMRA